MSCELPGKLGSGTWHGGAEQNPRWVGRSWGAAGGEGCTPGHWAELVSGCVSNLPAQDPPHLWAHRQGEAMRGVGGVTEGQGVRAEAATFLLPVAALDAQRGPWQGWLQGVGLEESGRGIHSQGVWR